MTALPGRSSAAATAPDTVGLLEAMATTPAMRRLRPDPVPLPVLASVVEMATMAPSGEDRQPWRFVVVTDGTLVAELGRLYAGTFEVVEPMVRDLLPPAMHRSVAHLAAAFGSCPAVIVVGGVDAPPAEAPSVLHATWYGSLFPAVQNVLLAARAHGLGTTLTTLLVARQDEVRSLLAIPGDVTLVAAVPVGYPEGRFARPVRRPVAEVASLDRFTKPLCVSGKGDPT